VVPLTAAPILLPLFLYFYQILIAFNKLKIMSEVAHGDITIEERFKLNLQVS